MSRVTGSAVLQTTWIGRPASVCPRIRQDGPRGSCGLKRSLHPDGALLDMTIIHDDIRSSMSDEASNCKGGTVT